MAESVDTSITYFDQQGKKHCQSLADNKGSVFSIQNIIQSTQLSQDQGDLQRQSQSSLSNPSRPMIAEGMKCEYHTQKYGSRMQAHARN